MFIYLKNHRKCFIYIGACFLCALVLVFLSRNSHGFGQWYAASIFPILPQTIGRFFSLAPFSVAEFLIYGAILALFLFLLIIAIHLLRHNPLWKKQLSVMFRSLLCGMATFLLLLVLGCSINYNREPFASLMGLSIQESKQEELIDLCNRLIDDATLLAPQVKRDANGHFLVSKDSLHQEAIQSMKHLGQMQDSLAGYYPQPKPVTFSYNLSKLNLTGIYTPFTMEANYNTDVADYVIPYTICHELAHLKGFIKEDEAGFISYLACIESDSVDFQYSGTLNALIYVLNALYQDVNEDVYAEIYDRIPASVQADFACNRAYWQQFADDKVSHIAQNANHYYLKANAQSEGTKSYGKMVDLLLAYYAES